MDKQSMKLTMCIILFFGGKSDEKQQCEYICEYILVELLYTNDARMTSASIHPSIHPSIRCTNPTSVTFDVVERDFIRFSPNLATNVVTVLCLSIAERPFATPDVMACRCIAASAKLSMGVVGAGADSQTSSLFFSS